MEIEIASCQDCPFNGGILVRGLKQVNLFCRCIEKEIIGSIIEIPNSCPLRQDNTIVFKLNDNE